MNRNQAHMVTRRQALCQAGTGLGMVGLVGLLGCDRASAKDFHEIRAVFTRRVA